MKVIKYDWRYGISKTILTNIPLIIARDWIKKNLPSNLNSVETISISPDVHFKVNCYDPDQNNAITFTFCIVDD